MLAPAKQKQLVLIGGGHAHIQVLKRFAMKPLSDMAITLISDRDVGIYSGMVPGLIAGSYQAEELQIDLVPLAALAGARFVRDAATSIQTTERQITLGSRPPINYDIVSLNLGAPIAGADLPGVGEFALPTRPIAKLTDALGSLDKRVAQGEPDAPVVVVGGGAGGVEIAFCVAARLASGGVKVRLIAASSRLLPDRARAVADAVMAAARTRGIDIVLGQRVTSVSENQLGLQSGEHMPHRGVCWTVGVTGPEWFADSQLPVDAGGFVLTDSFLRVVGHSNVFAAGDCATLQEHPELPKAGVYAVRQGPVLADNLRARANRTALKRYEPQQDYLGLLDLGDGTAIGTKWGQVRQGRWVMRLKRRIDRAFIKNFQALDSEGRVQPSFRKLFEMDEEMSCGGCAAKLPAQSLERALRNVAGSDAEHLGSADSTVLLGLDLADDAAAYRTSSGDIVVRSVDVFKAFSDDSYVVGQVAAMNAISDLYACGATPRHALALLSLPEHESPRHNEATLSEVLAGARVVFAHEGVHLLGGHTTIASELSVGFSVDGSIDEESQLLRLDAMVPGNALVLTKALGTGTLLLADRLGRARASDRAALYSSMLRSNGPAAALAVKTQLVAATDVSGFGLAYHLHEMVAKSGVSATLYLSRLPLLPGTASLMQDGLRSSAHPFNSQVGAKLRVDDAARQHPVLPTLYDPQTSGGLIIALPQAQAKDFVNQLHELGDPSAAVIGEAMSSEPPTLRISV